LTCTPEIRVIDLDPFTDDYIVMASDGLFDKATSQEVVSFISEKLSLMPNKEQELSKVA